MHSHSRWLRSIVVQDLCRSKLHSSGVQNGGEQTLGSRTETLGRRNGRTAPSQQLQGKKLKDRSHATASHRSRLMRSAPDAFEGNKAEDGRLIICTRASSGRFVRGTHGQPLRRCLGELVEGIGRHS